MTYGESKKKESNGNKIESLQLEINHKRSISGEAEKQVYFRAEYIQCLSRWQTNYGQKVRSQVYSS